MQLNPYLMFNDQCEAAFKFYEKCLGGKIVAMMPHAGTPAENHVSAQRRDKIMHARLNVGDDVLMGSDTPPDDYEKPRGFFRDAADQNARRGGPCFPGPCGKRHREDADSGNLLGGALRHARRQVRHPMDDQLRQANEQLV